MAAEKEAKAERINQMLVALQEAVSALEPETEVTAKPMFGGAGYYADGILFAMWYGEGLALKLAEADGEELLKIPGTAPSFTPANIETPETFLAAPDLLEPWVEKSLAYSRARKPTGRKATPATKRKQTETPPGV